MSTVIDKFEFFQRKKDEKSREELFAGEFRKSGNIDWSKKKREEWKESNRLDKQKSRRLDK